MNSETSATEALASASPDSPVAEAAVDLAADPADPAALAAAEAEAARLAAERQAAQEAEDRAAAEREARLQRLMQRIAKHADFASMKDSTRLLQKIARSENAHARALSGAISDDVAMTAKLLRLVNAAFYSSAGGGSITSLQRAVALMGFQTIGMVANSLMLFERLPKGADGNRLRQEFGRAQLAALLAHQFCNSSKQLDGAYLIALFQNLGGMLAGLHFADDMEAIEAALQARELAEGSLAWQEGREKLAREQWGQGLEDIAIEVARQWGWPESVRMGMRTLRPSNLERACSPEEYQRVLCTAANDLAAQLLKLPHSGSPEERAEARKACVERFAAELAVPLGLDPEPMPEAVESVKQVWDDLAQTLGFGAVVAAPAAAGKSSSSSKPAKPGDLATPANKAAPAPAAAAPRPAARPAAANPAMAEALSSALEQLSEMVLSGAAPGQLLQLCMKQMHEALNLQRVIVCLRDASHGGSYLKGRMGLGERATVLAPLFDIPLAPPTELFGLLCSKGADTLISDTADPVIAQRLPAWHRQQVRAGTFVLLPMVAGGQVLGTFYGDRAEAGTLHISERELTLLKTLRNQVVMAMRFGGGKG
ncbi:HDOD domain-containing protein [Paucibacter sp. DJ2R-2]|uniref:HDOD domain-containing protein n=1 Tax=Paucibacter sp. DJ2R-2 TaxID=2893558 RepID=UPI0021E47511|nr:HDOD domain-containing protein [Paucibacter sp. DJ2R-2]MCV2421801.1 HDOD domain-containing protein [Paucibacter sp. DJ4R-1]MCV2439582.1 HDOD domain-containing protein [Paucibacter sp. DJ2R-2]